MLCFIWLKLCPTARLGLIKKMWDKVFKNRPSKTCGRQPLKIRTDITWISRRYIPSNVLEAVFHKFYFVSFDNHLYRKIIFLSRTREYNKGIETRQE